MAPLGCRAPQISPRPDLFLPGEPASVDLEDQEIVFDDGSKNQHRIGRIAITNTIGQSGLDTYAAYCNEDGVRKKVPPERFMVAKSDLLIANGAQPARLVEKWVMELLTDRPVIFHDKTSDIKKFYHFDAAKFFEDHCTLIDTQELCFGLDDNKKPSLATCARLILGEEIQGKVHSPVEDSQTAMKLYLRDYPYDRAAMLAKMKSDGTYRKVGAYSMICKQPKNTYKGKADKKTAFNTANPNNGSTKKRVRKLKQAQRDKAAKFDVESESTHSTDDISITTAGASATNGGITNITVESNTVNLTLGAGVSISNMSSYNFAPNSAGGGHSANHNTTSNGSTQTCTSSDKVLAHKKYRTKVD
ncbi:hypothetical protein B0A48_00523 [Cryoendolithus antarcticus]|uniref:Exonuclease domain-containing protein n=1 Tax=Cryoendolithus antarcticus TaxID=1507870 RepID=A0A1V8TV44_9PEZI|nr:hypothetical protein B0A48_00523 [Cryoendolithus antarcticus]